MKQTKIVFAAIAIGLLTLAPVALAAEFIVPSQEDGGVVSINLPHKNLYVVGGSVQVDSPIAGDLYAAGGMVNVSADVEQDLVAAGATVNVIGTIGGDARLASGNIFVQSQIDGDLLVAGGNVNISSQSTIGGDLAAGGGNVIIEAPVAGSAWIGGGNVTINSKISGNVYARVGQRLVFGPRSEVTGKVVYQGREAPIIKEGAKVPNIEFTEMARERFGKKLFAGLFALASLIKLAAFFVAVLLLAKFMRKRVHQVVRSAHDEPWKNLGIGFLGAVVIPAAVLILFITFIGSYTAVILLIWFALAVTLTGLFAALLAGTLLQKWLKKNAELKLDWPIILLGTLIFGTLWFIPVIGWIALLLLYLMSFGGILRMFSAEIKNNQ